VPVCFYVVRGGGGGGYFDDVSYDGAVMMLMLVRATFACLRARSQLFLSVLGARKNTALKKLFGGKLFWQFAGVVLGSSGMGTRARRDHSPWRREVSPVFS
jgi:hypothetical protein